MNETEVSRYNRQSVMMKTSIHSIITIDVCAGRASDRPDGEIHQAGGR